VNFLYFHFKNFARASSTLAILDVKHIAEQAVKVPCKTSSHCLAVSSLGATESLHMS